jgi:gliding motility-associated-like protein
VAGNDTIICPGETATLWAQGGVSYVWSPSASLNNSTSPQVYATPISPTLYYVIGTDANGCTDADSVYVDVYPQPFIQTVPDAYAFEGDEVQLSATSASPGPFVWSPASYLTCTNCTSPIANPDQNFTYIVSYTDNNGCTASDSVTIFYDPVIWIPNTFTPDSDDFNNFFNAIGANIRSFEMLIFDRWGELICTLNDINESWDGTFKGKPCQDGTYIWKLKYVDLNNDEKIMTGHINLLR